MTGALSMAAVPARAGASASERSGLERSPVVDIQRSRVLSAMTHVAAEHGAPSVTVTQIVERAGISRRTFYELFADCEECLLAAIEHALSRARGPVLAAYDRKLPWRARVREALLALLGFLDEDRAAARLLVVECLAVGPRALDLRQRTLRQMIAAVDEGRRESKTGWPVSSLTAEAIVGGALSLVHARIATAPDEPLTPLVNELMSTIVLPYLGGAAARRELGRPLPPPSSGQPSGQAFSSPEDPFRAVGMRLTYRTARVLNVIAEQPGASNKQVAHEAEIGDQGQMSKLLSRLQHLGLIANTSTGRAQWDANAWTLTEKGREVHAHASLTNTGGES